MDTENQKVMLLVYEVNETLQEMIISTNVLWSYFETSNKFNRSAFFSKFKFIVEGNSLQLYVLKYMVRHSEWTVSLFTILTPLSLGIYNNSRTSVSYMPNSKPEITSAEFVNFIHSITLSEHYAVLSEVAREIGSLYGSSQNTSIQQLAIAYYTLENEIDYLSEIVKTRLQSYDNKILKAEAILTDVDCGLLCGIVIGEVCGTICAVACGCPLNLACCVFCGVACAIVQAVLCGYICGDIPTLCEVGCAAVCGGATALCGALAWLCEPVCSIGCLSLIGSLCEPTPPPPSGGGGGGCPFVFVWNGTRYVVDNNLLRYSLKYENDVRDYYRLEYVPAQRDGKYHLIIGEFQTEHSYIDEVRLIVVDHKDVKNVAVSQEGKIFTYETPLSPITAVDHNGNCWLNALNSVDNDFYEGAEGGYLLLNFGDVDLANGARLLLRADDFYKLLESVHVQLQDQTGEWFTVAQVLPRVHWATEVIGLSDFVSLREGKLQVRLYFTAPHKIDYVGLDISRQENVRIRYANLVTALHVEEGDVKAKLRNSDNIYAELIPGQFIKLEFTLPQNIKNARTFILYIKGRYNTITTVNS